MPREARAFFENRGSTTSRIELQARVEQSGLQDLAKLEEGGKQCMNHGLHAIDATSARSRRLTD